MTNASGMQGWCATFLCGVALALLLLGGCAGDDDTPRGRYTEPCSSAVENPCEDGLSCILNQCTQSCASTEECRMNLGSDNAYCQGGTCFELCSPTKPCENGLTCTMAGEMNGTCRP